jgi:cell division septation protein DedD
MFSSLLKHYFSEQNTAILPNFGAIIKTGNSYMYNEYLKYDDGKLAAALMQLNTCTKEEAQSTLSGWITDIINTLESGAVSDLGEIGILIKENGKVVLKKAATVLDSPTKPIAINPEQEKAPQQKATPSASSPTAAISLDVSAAEAIAHIQQTTDKSELIAYTRNETRKTVIDGLNKRLSALNQGVAATIDPLPKEPTVSSVETPIIQEEVVESPPSPVQEDAFKETIEETEKEIEELIHLTQPLTEPTTDEKIVSSPTEQQKSTKREQNSSPSQAVDSEDPELVIAMGVDKLEREDKRRRKKRILLILGMLFVLSGGGILGYINKDYLLALLESKPNEVAQSDTKKESTTNDKAEHVEKTVVEDPISMETEETMEIEEVEIAIVEKTQKPKKVESQPKNNYTDNASGGDYWLIAGSFSVEENAKNLVAKLKNEGFSGAYMDHSSGSLTKVIAGKYASKTEANSALEQLQSNGNKGFVQKK